MAGELLYIRHYYRTLLFPGRTAHSAAVADAGAGHGPLERPQYKFAAAGGIGRGFHYIKPCPPESHRIMDQGRDIGHQRDGIALPFRQAFYRLKQFFIFFFD